jgi:O-antigen ligase
VTKSAIPTTAAAMPDSRPRGAAIRATVKMILIGVLAIAPMPLASARPLAWSLLALASGLVLVVAAMAEFFDPTPASVLAPLKIPIALGVAVALWIAAQSLPLAASSGFAPIWDMAGQAMGQAPTPSISVARAESLSHALRLLSYAAVFLVAWRVGLASAGAAAIFRAVSMIGAVYSLYGLIVYFSGNQTILWFPKWAYKLDLTSTFVNRNFFAAFVGLCLMANLALMAEAFAKHIDGRSPRTLVQSSIECVLWRARWTAVGLVIMGSALLFTHSRGGALVTLIGAATLVASTWSAPSLRAPWRVPFAALAVLAAIVVFTVNGGGLLSRIVNTAVETDLRFDIDSGTWRAIADHYAIGTGLGSFQFIYAPYQPQSVGLFVNLAHNDYLENMLELGVPAAAMFYAMILLLVFQCALGVVRRRRDAIFACTGLGASALVGSHALVDFAMQMPAVAVTYAALLGVGVAQSVGTKRRTAPTRIGGPRS